MHIAKNKVIHSYNAGRWKEGWSSVHLEMRKLRPRPFMWLIWLESGAVLSGPCPPHWAAFFHSNCGEHTESYISSKHLGNLSFYTEKHIQSLYNPQDMHSSTQLSIICKWLYASSKNQSIHICHQFVTLYKTKMSWAVIVILR